MKTNLQSGKWALLFLFLISASGVLAQSNQSPTQTVNPGNEPYLVTATPGSTYSWTITPGQSGNDWRINGTGNNITVAWITSGVYTLSVVEQNTAGCTGLPSIVEVTVIDRPDVTATPASESICSGNSTNISLSSSNITATFAWTATLTSGTASGFSNGVGPTIIQTLTNATTSVAMVTYTITPSINGNPGNPINVTVTVYPLPVPTISGDANPVCLGTSGIRYTTETGMSSYTWVVRGGIVTSGGTSTDNSVTVTWNGASPYSVSVNYHNSDGCTSTSPVTRNVNVTPLPTTSPIFHN